VTAGRAPGLVECVLGGRLALTAHHREEARQRLQEGATQADLARSYGVSQATISRLAGGL